MADPVGNPTCRGLSDKLYWRRPYPGSWGTYHCFKKTGGEVGFMSLCGRFYIQHSGGQAISRPEAILRCARCDNLEMERRGWDESGPVTEPQLSPWNKRKDKPSS